MATERELKFSTADDHVPSTLELELALAGSAWSASTGRVSRHIDVYYDADGRLGMAGVALRHRRSSGGQRVTLKADAGVTGAVPREDATGPTGVATGALHARTELEVALPPLVPTAATDLDSGAGNRVAWPAQVLAALPAGVAEADLAPVAELRIRRVAYLVAPAQADGGAPLVELAFDEVTCVSPGAAADPTSAAVFHEVELEWLGDEDSSLAVVTATLAGIAEAVATVVQLTASPVSKLHRALALLSALNDD